MTVLAHGIDIVDVERIARVLQAHEGRFLERCFTPDERAYAMGRHEPAVHLAARFALKEAVTKAIGTGVGQGVSWLDVELVRTPSGAPEVRLTGKAADIAQAMGITAWHVSVSHTRELASASAIGVADDQPRAMG